MSIILRDPGHKEYGRWDLILASAYHVYSDMMRGSVPIYWDESDRVAFEVKAGKSKSRAAIERREEQDQKTKKDTKGVYYYAVPRTIDGGALPTLAEWQEERAGKMGVDKRKPSYRSPLVGLDGNPLEL